VEDGFTVVDLAVKVLRIEESIIRTTGGIVGIYAVEGEANEAVGEKINSELDDTHNTTPRSQNIISVL